MDSQIPMKLVNWFRSAQSEAFHYTHDEFLGELRNLKRKHEDLLKEATHYGVGSEARLHRHIIENILNPLIGKLEYGKRN